MTIYSVYNYDTKRFRYYETSGFGDIPKSGTMREARNTLPEGLAARLPFGAVPVGEGEEPKGVIATDQPAGLSIFSSVTGKDVFYASLTAALLWWKWRRWRRRSRR